MLIGIYPSDNYIMNDSYIWAMSNTAPNDITSKMKRFKYPFALIGVLAVAFLMIGSMLPGEMGIPSVRAEFGTPTYSDTFISPVTMYGNASAVVQSWSRSVNPNEVPDLALNTWVEVIACEIQVATARLAPGGTTMSHVAVSGSITDPTGTVTTLTEAAGESGGYWIGSDHGYYFYMIQWTDLNYMLDEVGTYRLYITMSIEVP